MLHRTVCATNRKHRWLGHVLRHDNLLRNIIKGKTLGKVTRGRNRMELLHDGRSVYTLWTVERFNLGQIKMETGQQVRMHVRNLLETAED